MANFIKKAFVEEVKVYGLFVSLIMICCILFLITAFIIIIFFPDYYANCNFKIAFASTGTFLVSTGLIQRAKTASRRASSTK